MHSTDPPEVPAMPGVGGRCLFNHALPFTLKAVAGLLMHSLVLHLTK